MFFSRTKSKSPASTPVMIQRVRLRLARRGPAAMLSHLQQIDAVRRALKSANWPVATSPTKKSRLKVSFGPAISVGYESDAEYCDVETVARLDPAKARTDLQAHLSEGLSLLEMKSIPRFFPSLEESVNAALYEVRSEALKGSEPRWQEFDRQSQFIVVKKKQDRDEAIDARSLVRTWAVNGDALTLTLRFGPGRTLKPERLIQAVCGLPDEPIQPGEPSQLYKVRRLKLFFEKQTGELTEP